MKVLVVNSMAPFVWGGAEELAAHLQKQLAHAGHESEVLRIPFQWEPPERIPSQMLLVRALELDGVDRVIALKFPAYLIRHPRKTIWLLHQYRQAYDLLGTAYSNVGVDRQGRDLQRLIMRADAEGFTEAQRVFTNSEVTRERLARYNGISATVLPPPLNDEELFTGGASEGYIFAGGRINAAKRQHLLIAALAKAPVHVRLVVAGPPDTPDDAQRLARLVESLGLGGRVVLDLRFLPRAELAHHVNHAAAVAYIPYDEDSLGYVAMEAAAAAKPILTTRDSGGVLTLARHGESGWVTEPDASALAGALAEASTSPQRSRTMGLAAREIWQGLAVNWPTTLERLLL